MPGKHRNLRRRERKQTLQMWAQLWAGTGKCEIVQVSQSLVEDSLSVTGHETGNQSPIDRANDLSRAPNAAPGNPPLRKDPRVFFICTKGGRGGAEPDPHTCRSRKSSIEDPPQFFGQIFWEKILETKILAPLVTIFLATHPATPAATAPRPAQDIFCTQGEPDTHLGAHCRTIALVGRPFHARDQRSAKICWEYVDAMACGLAPIRQICRR